MARTMSQELNMSDDDWHKSYTQPHQPQDESALSFASETPILDETIAIVKEKVWSFRAALKNVAEALVSFGLSPSVVGYSTVPLGDNDCLAEKDEGEAALQQVIDKEILSRSYSRASEDDGHEHRGPEESRLIHPEEYEDESNHAFVDAGRKEADEMKSLTGRWSGELDNDEDEVVDKRET